jgi:hypothetical protein
MVKVKRVVLEVNGHELFYEPYGEGDGDLYTLAAAAHTVARYRQAEPSGPGAWEALREQVERTRRWMDTCDGDCRHDWAHSWPPRYKLRPGEHARPMPGSELVTKLGTGD